ncbi:peptidylprolyl isomerase [Iamia sp. SCSIO 61187]|uniref:peptidylprolyl isomerase n=1 Tax=Iamia sp. SCSIO 61187 TaxID=2722752 RepID=UPI001C629C14|nr:peptidylprolyl isomerase [Iamia sp. SCSIO 61187]QYG94977.1 peptidylprolyl isomerase [Iamia sp. SCSIO 61187]
MTSLEKRQRHKEGHRSRVEQARIAAARARRRNRVLRILVGILVVVLGVAVVAVLLQDDPPGDESADDATTTTDTTAPDDAGTTVPVTPVVLPPGPEGATIEGETPCPAEDGSEERVAVFAQAPPTCIEEGQALVAEIAVDLVDDAGEATPAGTIVVELDAEAAPQAVNNFVVLSRYQFYDGIPFHRLVPDFVAQVGGSGAPGADGAPDYGTTGPGYDLEDVEHPEDGYAVGDVAMARAETVSGSQFFIVTSESALQALDQAGNYPRFGRVTEGLELAAEMASQGDPATNGGPLALYVIRDITIRPA